MGSIFILMCVLIYGKAIVTYAISVLRKSFIEVAAAVRVKLISALSTSWAYGRNISPGKYVAFASIEIDKIGSWINLATQLCLGVVSAAVYVAVALSLNWMVGVFAGVIGIASAFAVRPFLRTAYEVAKVDPAGRAKPLGGPIHQRTKDHQGDEPAAEDD